MANSTLQEQYDKLQKEIEQKKAKQKDILKKQKAAERKAQNSLKYAIGGEVVRVLDHRPLNENDVSNFSAFLEQQEKNGKYFTRWMNNPEYNPELAKEKDENADPKDEFNDDVETSDNEDQ